MIRIRPAEWNCRCERGGVSQGKVGSSDQRLLIHRLEEKRVRVDPVETLYPMPFATVWQVLLPAEVLQMAILDSLIGNLRNDRVRFLGLRNPIQHG